MRLRRCEHHRVRCVHGDEINAAMTLMDAVFARPYRRAACVDCGCYLLSGLPEPCTVTGEAHSHLGGGDDE